MVEKGLDLLEGDQRARVRITKGQAVRYDDEMEPMDQLVCVSQ